MRGVKLHSTSPPCGNLVDALPHACHNTETIAKLARLAPAENGKLMENFIESTSVCIITLIRVHRFSSSEYIEDLEKYVKMSKS